MVAFYISTGKNSLVVLMVLKPMEHSFHKRVGVGMPFKRVIG